MKYLILSVFFLFFFLSNLSAQIQDSTKLITVETKKKKYFIGELISITSDSIYIKDTDGQRIALGKKNVKTVHNGLISTEFKETTNSSVPFFVQTAMPNGKGNHYYKNYYIFGNEFNYGLTDNFNVSLGFETATLIFNNNVQLPVIQLGLKYGISAQEHIHIGLSPKFYFNNEGSVLLVDAPITFGGKRTNFTLSPNIAFFDGTNSVGIASNLSLGLSDRSRFVIDYTYLHEENIAAIMYEYLFRSGFSLSFGALITAYAAVPNFSFSIPFGRWKR